jgi:carboxyl-terminal processing protease
MLEGLPRRTAYFPAREARRQFQSPQEKYFGLTLGAAVPYPVILRVERGSSADLASVHPGEEVIEISGHPTSGRSVAELYADLALAKTDELTLGLRTSGSETRHIVLRRSLLSLKHSLECRILNQLVLYLKPNELGPGVAGQAKEAALSAGAIARRIILDLRDTRDGDLYSGVALADLFVRQGILEEIEMRDKIVRWNAQPGDPLEQSVTIALVGSGTAESAATLAAALQELNRSTTLGDTPKGDGELTTWFWLKGGDALRLTVAQVRRPSPSEFERAGADAPASDGSPAMSLVEDVACPGSSSEEPVASDPVVARALRMLLPTSKP